MLVSIVIVDQCIIGEGLSKIYRGGENGIPTVYSVLNDL
jgi:hypothetical protein